MADSPASCRVVSLSAGHHMSEEGSPPFKNPVDHVGSGAAPISVPIHRRAFGVIQLAFVGADPPLTTQPCRLNTALESHARTHRNEAHRTTEQLQLISTYIECLRVRLQLIQHSPDAWLVLALESAVKPTSTGLESAYTSANIPKVAAPAAAAARSWAPRISDLPDLCQVAVVSVRSPELSKHLQLFGARRADSRFARPVTQGVIVPNAQPAFETRSCEVAHDVPFSAAPFRVGDGVVVPSAIRLRRICGPGHESAVVLYYQYCLTASKRLEGPHPLVRVELRWVEGVWVWRALSARPGAARRIRGHIEVNERPDFQLLPTQLRSGRPRKERLQSQGRSPAQHPDDGSTERQRSGGHLKFWAALAPPHCQ